MLSHAGTGRRALHCRTRFFGRKTLVFGLDNLGGFEQPPGEYKKPRAAEGCSLPGQMMVTKSGVLALPPFFFCAMDYLPCRNWLARSYSAVRRSSSSRGSVMVDPQYWQVQICVSCAISRSPPHILHFSAGIRQTSVFPARRISFIQLVLRLPR